MKYIILSDEEINSLIAALNYTKHRTLGTTWWPQDEKIYAKLKEIQSSEGYKIDKQDYR